MRFRKKEPPLLAVRGNRPDGTGPLRCYGNSSHPVLPSACCPIWDCFKAKHKNRNKPRMGASLACLLVRFVLEKNSLQSLVGMARICMAPNPRHTEEPCRRRSRSACGGGSGTASRYTAASRRSLEPRRPEKTQAFKNKPSMQTKLCLNTVVGGSGVNSAGKNVFRKAPSFPGFCPVGQWFCAYCRPCLDNTLDLNKDLP